MMLNFDFLPQNELGVEHTNRAFCYGDGIFETLLFHNHTIRYWPEHFHRLSAGMQALSLTKSPRLSIDYLESQIKALLLTNGLENTARIRIQVWRQTGGLYTPASNESNILMTAQAASPACISVKEKARFFYDIRLQHSVISAYKTCNSLPYVLAGIAKQQTMSDDMILLDQSGHVAECIASNLFWIRDQTLYTPSLQSGCIDGIMRKAVIKNAIKSGFTFREGLFPESDLLAADQVFCCNVAGLQWIKQIEEQVFDAVTNKKIEETLLLPEGLARAL